MGIVSLQGMIKCIASLPVCLNVTSCVLLVYTVRYVGERKGIQTVVGLPKVAYLCVDAGGCYP